jgi:hypothetical protein
VTGLASPLPHQPSRAHVSGLDQRTTLYDIDAHFSSAALGSKPHDTDDASLAAAVPTGIDVMQPDDADVARDSDEPAGADVMTPREIPLSAFSRDVEAELPVETEDRIPEVEIHQSEASEIAELEDTVGVPQVLAGNQDVSYFFSPFPRV